jgi:hypothetical protein
MDEELEETDELTEPGLSDFTGSSNDISTSVDSNIHAESSSFSIFVLFFGQFFKLY